MRRRGSASRQLRVSVRSRMKVGFLGLGIMGAPMALNLMAKGIDVMVWNRNTEKCVPLEEKGARSAATAAEVAAACDVTIVMVSDPAAAIAVAEAASKGLKTGAGYVDMSTVDAATAQAVDGIVRAAGARYLEAPVSGSKKPAEGTSLSGIACVLCFRFVFGDAACRELMDKMRCCCMICAGRWYAHYHCRGRCESVRGDGRVLRCDGEEELPSR